MENKQIHFSYANQFGPLSTVTTATKFKSITGSVWLSSSLLISLII